MAIEVKVNGEQEGKREYPYLGRSRVGGIVLFTEKGKGMVVNKDTGTFGHYSEKWSEDAFTPLSPSESITLSNKA